MVTPRWSFLLVALSLGCATAGPAPEPTMAVLGSSGIVVHTIDERNVRDDTADPTSARFEIAPGRHTVEISLYTGPPAEPGTPVPEQAPAVMAICFGATAGHIYVARAVVEGKQWYPEILDETEGTAVRGGCGTAVAAAPVPAPIPAAPVIAGRIKPGTGINAGVGFFFGGDDLYQVTFFDAPDRKLSAGRGVQVSLGAMWTPLWVDERLGIGGAISAAWKYDSIAAQNGQASLTRFPVTATGHALFRLDDRWFLLLSAGLATELAGRTSGRGFAAGIDTDLEAGLGFVGDAGLHFAVQRVGFGAGVRYTRLGSRIHGVKVDASSVGLGVSAQYAF